MCAVGAFLVVQLAALPVEEMHVTGTRFRQLGVKLFVDDASGVASVLQLAL